MWENHECCFISSSDRSSSRRTVIASGNRVPVGADGVVVEVTSYRAFWPLAQRPTTVTGKPTPLGWK